MSVKPTNIPKCHLRQSADSAGNISRHCKLGELTENIRTFALPNKPRPYTFKMKFYYDSWNRIDSMTYPDGEVVSYGYNKGGMLENIRGNKNGDVRTYVESIRYNKFELKESEIYGNATWMSYEYDSLLRLSHLYSWDGNGDTMQSIGYTYDYVGNITDIANSAVTLPNGLGGRYYSHYDYDPMYRLTGAYGDWNNNQLSYNLGMQYYGNGKIWSKQLYADVLEQGNVTVRNYNNRYYYGSSTSNTVASVYDQTGHVWQSFSWDMAGNMVYHQDANGCGRTLCWDEENRLMSFADCENAGFYQYDAGGERTYKLTSDYVSQNIGGHWHTYQMLDNPTLYTSPYMVATPKGYTKHYYAESERVASRIGGGLDSVDMFIQNFEEFVDKPVVEISPLWTEEYHEEPFDEKRHHNLDHLYHAMECTGNVPSVVYECLIILHKYSDFPHHEYEPDCYWYHPDHLGSSSWITFSDGKAVQHLHYLPWGENFVDQRSSTFDGVRYTFSAKEKDAETGYSYFGSRYYNSDLSIWLSVDPQAAKYPSLSPYVYCADNPVKLVDPNGEEVVIILGEYMKESDRQQALNDLRNAAPNLNLELVGDKLVVGDGGTAKTKYEEKLLGAISSSTYKSEITLELNETAGSYMGTDLVDGQYVSKNSVNPYKMKEIENETRSVRGCGLMHEITEGFEMGKIAEREKLTHIDKAWRNPGEMTIGERSFPNDEVGPQHHLYEEGHSLATPQPGDWKAKPKRFFK